MDNNIIKSLSKNLNIKEEQINAVLNLLSDGATVPFIARYRKEATGALDENEIREINKEFEYQKNLLDRKEAIKRLIDEKGLLTSELASLIDAATKLQEIEDLYLPYKEKKKTRGSIARSKGFEPLAKYIESCPQNVVVNEVVKPYLTEEVTTVDEALGYASDIIAEDVSDNANFRKIVRNNTKRRSTIVTKIKKNAKDDKETYSNYYDYSESISTIKNHRILAINRAEKENILSVSLVGDDDNNILYIKTKVIFRDTVFKSLLEEAIRDAYKRLIYPSIEREIRAELTLKAETDAINIFSLNLKNLLMQPPLKDKTVLGLDPAFRTGCKLAVVDNTGKLLEIAVIHPTEEYPGSGVKKEALERSEIVFVTLVKKYKVDVVTIGNGTASRESEEFVSNTIKKYNLDCKYTIVSEAGASVYSASKIAQDEFPDLTLEKRSAVSIARRIQDPLAELVKIEPKAIGVGQYQHDVDQKALDQKLGEVVESCVNSVGVDINTASPSLLEYVSGLNKTIAANIVEYRNTNGKFTSRNELKKVSKLGEKTYQQCAGFIRVYESSNILDKTPIHPESYSKALEVAKYLDIDLNELGTNEVVNIVNQVNKSDVLANIDVDKYTLDDILDCFKKPQRDIRDTFSSAKLQSNQTHLEDLHVGDELEGTVRNVVDFGVFVDCGLHEAGLVHISKMSKGYVKHPCDLVKVGDIVKVYVIGIDLKKQKLALSMIKD